MVKDSVIERADLDGIDIVVQFTAHHHRDLVIGNIAVQIGIHQDDLHGLRILRDILLRSALIDLRNDHAAVLAALAVDIKARAAEGEVRISLIGAVFDGDALCTAVGIILCRLVAFGFIGAVISVKDVRDGLLLINGSALIHPFIRNRLYFILIHYSRIDPTDEILLVVDIVRGNDGNAACNAAFCRVICALFELDCIAEIAGVAEVHCRRAERVLTAAC